MIYCKEIHPLPLNCFITFLRCIMKMWGTSDSRYTPLMVHTVSFLPRSTLKLHQNARFWVPSLGGKGDDALQLEIYIAGEVFHTFIECIMTFGGDSGFFLRHLMVHTVSFLPRLILKLHIKCRMLGTLFSQTTGWCAARKGIHWCWSILNLH